ncbi:hypothetical protein J2T57_000942 [Natronocella acetinitrilica]|uniref:Uncharacterized protein n=2 Tax=Natronocella acetinitrilica TaxID=414046 RepID=A0AAE3G3U5_9GAMM|nr:hypothetical protein [Natronocella acetinitrilica]
MSEEHRIPGVELPDDMLDEVREHFDPANDEHR